MGGGTGNGYADRPILSNDATHVTFDSNATNLSTDPSNAHIREVFERNLTSNTTNLVSVSADGNSAGNNFSSYSYPDGDGGLVTFTSDATNLTSPASAPRRSVFVRNMSNTTQFNIPPHTTVLESVNTAGKAATGASSRSMISANGRYISFTSTATNLTSTATNGQSQEYLRDLQTGATTLISSAANGTAGNALSYRGFVGNDPTLVAFDSKSSNLVTGDTNGQEDIFVKNTVTGAITRISSKSGGARPYMTPNSQWVTFNANAPLLPSDTNGTLTDVYVYNTQTHTLSLGSPAPNGKSGNGQSLRGFTTNDGRYVVFNSFATNLVPRDTNGHGDCFIYDTQTHTTTMVTQSAAGGPANGNSFRPVPSGDGSVIAYLSMSTNLVPGGSSPAPAGTTTSGDDDQTTTYEAFATTVASLLPGGDTTAPAATIATPAAGATVGSPVSISGTATDNVAVHSVGVAIKDTTTGGTNSGEWLQSNGTWGAATTYLPAQLSNPDTASTSWSLSQALPDSTYKAQVQVADSTGNKLTPTPTQSFTVSTSSGSDTGPPVVAFSSPAGNATVSGSPFTVSGTATDDTSVTKVAVAIKDKSNNEYLQSDGTTWATKFTYLPVTLDDPNAASTAWEATFTLGNGSYSVNANSYDELNQQATTKPARSFTVDNSGPADSGPPSVAVSSPADNDSVTGSPFAINGTATDDTAVHKVAVAIRDNSTNQYLQSDGTTWGATFTYLPVTLDTPDTASTTWHGSFTLNSGSYRVTTNAYDEQDQQASTKPFVHITVP